jgi:hypothetical protein
MRALYLQIQLAHGRVLDPERVEMPRPCVKLVLVADFEGEVIEASA